MHLVGILFLRIKLAVRSLNTKTRRSKLDLNYNEVLKCVQRVPNGSVAVTLCYFIMSGTSTVIVKARVFLRTELTGPIPVQQVTLHLRPDTRVGLHLLAAF